VRETQIAAEQSKEKKRTYRGIPRAFSAYSVAKPGCITRAMRTKKGADFSAPFDFQPRISSY
jgi:hypothetical protein